MKKVNFLAQVDVDKCTGCRVCQKVCPVLAIEVKDRKAVVSADDCRACGNCEQRCQFGAIEMISRETPLEIGVDVSQYDQEKIKEICAKSHFNPEQVLCYCTAVRADEVAASILAGADTPEKVSLMTGIRTGCTIECIQPVLRMLEAAGHELKPVEGGWQWYGTTATAWTVPEEIKDKYSSRGFFFQEDKELLDEIAEIENK